MIKNILFLVILSTILIHGQNKWVAGASFNVGFPTGTFSNDAKTGIGGSLIGEYFFNKNFSLVLAASYQNYPSKFSETAVQGVVLNASFNSIPVVFGGRYYIKNGLYTTIELGSYFFRISVDASNYYSKEKYSTDYQAKFGGAFGIGYRFDLSAQSAMDLSGVYQIVEDDLNSISLRLGILIYLDTI